MGLFSRLLHLHSTPVPQENFFTEVVAQLFDTSPQICMDWVRHEQLSDAEYDGVRVSTQHALAALEDHTTGSCPDMLIGLHDGQNTDVILVESKIGSREGDEQLRRYAQHLEHRSDARSKTLLYITRDYEPKDKDKILAGLEDNSVCFKQLRWHDFYHFLKTQPETDLIAETLRFMEERGMAQSNQFTPVDILAISNMPKALSMMDETMSGEVSAKFEAVAGKIARSSTRTLHQLRDGTRYFIYSTFQEDWTFYCGLGYHPRPMLVSGNHPSVVLHLEASPKSPHWQEIIDAMREIVQHKAWYSMTLGDPQAASRIKRERSLSEFLSSEDHVVEIKKFFLDSLDELQEIKEQYPHLPWGS